MDFLFELDAPGAGPKPAVPPATPSLDSAPGGGLFELDAPGAAANRPTRTTLEITLEDEELIGQAQSGDQEEPSRSTVDLLHDGGERSTMEFLADLEALGPSRSREIDLDAEPALAAAIAAPAVELLGDAGEPAPAEPAAPAAPEVIAPHVDLPDLTPLALDTQPDKSKAGEALLRLQRTVLRVATCRDALRLMGTLGVQDTERANAARMLMEIDRTLGRAESAPSVVKSPEQALKEATSEQLDAVEHALGAIEDKLLWLDEQVSPAAFRTVVASGKQTKKVLGRYARLLACRRFMAGQRRDRFEWIVTDLMTAADAEGRHRVLPPERARPVLQHVIGQLPRKVKEQEVSEAVTYLQEALVRLESIGTHEEFFENGFFLDVHGYKVSMRELLVVPEFVYLCVLINARVHNRIEHWIADRERLHRAQVAVEISVRDEIERLLREQEEAVDDIFSIKKRPAALTPGQAPEAQKAAPAPKSKKRKAKGDGPRFEIVVDRQFYKFVAALVGICLAGAVIMFETDSVGVAEVHVMTAEELEGFSPVVARGWILGSGKKATLKALIRSTEWGALNARSRTAEADRIAKALAGRGIRNAIIVDRNGAKFVEIQDGLAAYVQGGKL